MATTAEMTVGEFSDALAAQTSTPGGGGAAALAGAMAAALLSMVVNFTLGKKKYAEVQEEMARILVETEAIRVNLLALADADVEAFSAVAATYSMPKESDFDKSARSAALQSALKGATKVPFVIAERCLSILILTAPVAEKGNSNVVGDAVTAMHLAQGALHGAIVNVDINLKAIKDESFVGEWGAKRDTLLAEADLALAVARRACASALGEE
jgi:formiminotetrahydrofolate cyclodeaminase